MTVEFQLLSCLSDVDRGNDDRLFSEHLILLRPLAGIMGRVAMLFKMEEMEWRVRRHR
ncbi:MAG TPA: hypothetical protein VEZ90_11305 [Blastocatellia bacterium]|nr:hypothetical protein [Blastocatellia bacterium]